MPLFRKQSEKAKKRFEHQVYLAKEDPEPTYDISGCELSEVPSSVFSLCRVLQKKALLLHDNWLGSFGPGEKLSDLSELRVLDLHNNELKELPDNIGKLEKLQVLNVEGNKLKKLPDSIGDLSDLQTLNVKGNKLRLLPNSLCHMQSLRLLDISGNQISVLPNRLCQVRTLETLVLDADQMKYPAKDICLAGTEDIMKTLCNDCGIEYQPPSNFLLNVLEPPKVSRTNWSNSSLKALQQENKMLATVEQYASQQEKKRQDRLALERQMQAEQEDQALMAVNIASQKDHLLAVIAQDQLKLEGELEELSQRRELEKLQLVRSLQEVEKNASDLIEQLVIMSEKAKRNEEILEAIEKERIENDDHFQVRWEEIQLLRRQEVLRAMQHVLKESDDFEQARQLFTLDREDIAKRALEEETLMAGHQVESVLYNKEIEQRVMMDTLSQQDKLQRQAFQALQLQKDAKHSRITNQIALIEDELLQLTVVEVEKRKMRQESEVNFIAEKRIALTAMLAQLLEEREKRQDELHKRVVEMEEQREEGQVDYWLVQYQRLMDRKPQRLIDKENMLEISVVKILQQADAEDYIPQFARHRVTIEVLANMTEDNLKQMGVHEVGLRKAILMGVAKYQETEEKPKKVVSADNSPMTPTAPPPSLNSPAHVSPSDTFARQLSITARGLHSECTVCMEKESAVLFMNCGHVCCCSDCAQPLQLCPLCRSPIVQRIKLSLPAC